MKKVLIVVLIILVLGLVGYVVYKQFIEETSPVADNQQPGENNDNQSINLDTSGASHPNLHNNMIPIRWSGENWVVADKNNSITDYQWYDYNERQWANAVTVTSETREKYKNANPGTTVEMEDILTMMVWIPRYRYQLWNANNESSDPQEINIIFEGKDTTPSCGGNECTTNRRYNTGTNGEWLTHPAFTFGEKELDGFWIGKFETSSSTVCSPAEHSPNGTGCNRTDLIPRVIPNVTSWRGIDRSNVNTVARNMSANNNQFGYEASVETHALTNMQWGAVSYLSHSKYGRCINGECSEITINNSSTYTTGCAGNGVSAAPFNGCQNQYHTSAGGLASTTGNIYGVYDMSGGAWDIVMGNSVASGQKIGTLNVQLGGTFNPPLEFPKHFDSYAHSRSQFTTERGWLGDATKETIERFGVSDERGWHGGWYGVYSNFIAESRSWMFRGGLFLYGNRTGSFSFGRRDGQAYVFLTWRLAHL